MLNTLILKSVLTSLCFFICSWIHVTLSLVDFCNWYSARICFPCFIKIVSNRFCASGVSCDVLRRTVCCGVTGLGMMEVSVSSTIGLSVSDTIGVVALDTIGIAALERLITLGGVNVNTVTGQVSLEGVDVDTITDQVSFGVSVRIL